MRKILTILFVLSSLVSFSQFPKQLNAYNAKTQVNFLGGIGIDSSLAFNHNYPDTETVNLGFLKNIPNAIVLVNDTLRKRSNDATRWDKLGGGGSVGNTIYTGDGSLSGDRTIATNGHSLGIGESDYPVPALLIDLSAPDQMTVTIESFNETGNGNYGYHSSQATNDYGDAQLAAAFNDGATQANIHANALVSGATLSYTADTHTFNGLVGIGSSPITDNLFDVFNASHIPLIQIDTTAGTHASSMTASDGSAFSNLILYQWTGNKSFELASDDGVNAVRIRGDALLQSLALTSQITLVSNLATGSTAPGTSGTRQGIISDANGLLSFTNKTFDSIPYSATPTWNYLTGYSKTIKLTGDANLLFSNVQDGDEGRIIVIQDITGGHALTVPDQIVTLNTGAGDTTVLGWINQGGVYYWASSVVAPSGVTSVTGTTNRITSTGGTTPVIDISASYVGQSSITTLGTVTSGGLGTGAVVRGVTMTLGSDGTGDIYYRNSSGVLTRLAVGTSKQTLHGGTNPQWLDTTAISAGIIVGTTTVTSGTNARVLFDNSGTLGEYTISGSGSVAMTTSPSFTTPTLGAATATTINGNTFTTGSYTLTGQAAKTLTFNGSITLTGTDAQTYTFPTTSATLARIDAGNTFTGASTATSWTLTTPVISSIVNTGTLTLPTVTGTAVQYFETTTSGSATPSPAGDARVNWYQITALANATATFQIPSGTPANHNELYIRIKDSGTARTLAWTTSSGGYRASSDLPFPTTTIISKTMYLKFIYNGADSFWDLVSVINNF